MFFILCDVLKPDQYTEALFELQSFGLKNEFFLEDHDKKQIQIGGFISTIPKNLTHSLAKVLEESIDWENQSKVHSPYYSKGFIKIDLTKFYPHPLRTPLLLNPGAGFGDVSHETTKLMLKSMGKYVEDKVVIDVGSGNGVLSLASFLMKANKVIGVEIDPEALNHSKKNRSLNKLNKHNVDLKKALSLTDLSIKDSTVLMNMTLQEQSYIMEKNPSLMNNCKTFISSGILDSQISKYKKLIKKFDLKLLEINHIGEWYSFIFIR